MNKAHYTRIQKAWIDFDRSTALGCALGQRPYDREVAIQKWNAYNDVLEQCGQPRITHGTPFN
jgi:hypothetical protein